LNEGNCKFQRFTDKVGEKGTRNEQESLIVLGNIFGSREKFKRGINVESADSTLIKG